MSVSSSELAPTTPLPQASVSSPSEPKKGGQHSHSLKGEVAGGANLDDWRESLAYSVVVLVSKKVLQTQGNIATISLLLLAKLVGRGIFCM